MTSDRARRASYAPSSSTVTTVSASTGSSLQLSDSVRTCGYCTDAKQLRDVLPSKKCDYCFQFKCQFCTLKFPLLKSKKGLPKAMKGNSRICLPCFDSHWTAHSAATTATRGYKSHSDSVPPSRRSSQWQRDGNDDTAWVAAGGTASFDEATLLASRGSFLRESFNTSDPLASIHETKTTPVQAAQTARGIGTRLATALGLVVVQPSHGDANAPKSRHVIHVVDLWMSLFTAAILLAVALVDELSRSQRVAFCVVVYGVFLALHPWIHNSAAVATPQTHPQPQQQLQSSARRTSSSPSAAAPAMALPPRTQPTQPSTSVPAIYRSTFEQMQQRFECYVNDPSQWKFVKLVSGGGKIYEIPTERPETLLMLDVFVAGVTATEFLTFMNRTDVKSRSLWDWNMAAFEVVDEYPDDDACVVYNAQKSFLGGFVSARDFCLLYKRTPSSIVYASVEHAQSPEQSNTTRGTVHLAGVHCTPATTEDDDASDSDCTRGCRVQYLVQVDIGGSIGSIPARLLYNGQVDNMEKVTKSFRQGRKLLAKSAMYPY